MGGRSLHEGEDGHVRGCLAGGRLTVAAELGISCRRGQPVGFGEPPTRHVDHVAEWVSGLLASFGRYPLACHVRYIPRTTHTVHCERDRVLYVYSSLTEQSSVSVPGV